MLRRIIGFFIVLLSRFLYRPWIRMWRWLLDREYRGVAIPSNWTPSYLAQWLSHCAYRPDKLHGMVDYPVLPGRFFRTKKGDCDDFACFAAHVVDSNYLPYLLSVQWISPDHKFHGHMVCCLIDDQDQFYHIGNWGFYGPFGTETELIKSIMGGGKLISSVFFTKDLEYISSKPSC